MKRLFKITFAVCLLLFAGIMSFNHWRLGRLVHSETYVKQNLVIPEDAVKEETSETNDTNSGETSSADEDKNSMNTEDGVEKMMIAYGSMTGSALNR